MLLTEAIKWRGLGISVMPFKPEGKKFDKAAALKRGFNFHDFEKRLPDIPDLIYWFGRGRRKLAVITTDRFICVDFDSIKAYFRFTADYPHLTNTLTVQTPALNKPSPKCYHCYYWLDQPIDKPIEETWPKVEIKCCGDNAITHGEGYQIINDANMMRLENIFVLPFVEVKKVIPPQKEEKNKALQLASFAGEKTTNIDSKVVKHYVPIDRYLSDLGHSLRPVGEGKYITNCPFPAVHSNGDRKPSFWVDTRFRNCNCNKPECKAARHMDLFDLYQKINSCSFQEAIFDLATAYGLI